MTLTTDIKSTNWQLSTAGLGNVAQGVGDINQAIALILMTVKGSDPFRPEFGCDIWDYVDRPLNFAVPNIKLAITKAVTQYEPRIKLTGIAHAYTKADFEAEPMKSGAKFDISWTAKTGAGSGLVELLFDSESETNVFSVLVWGDENGAGVLNENDKLIVI